MKESNNKYECYYHPSLSTNTIISIIIITEFEDKVCISLVIVGVPQLSDKNFHVWRSIDLNKTMKNKAFIGLGSCENVQT